MSNIIRYIFLVLLLLPLMPLSSAFSNDSVEAQKPPARAKYPGEYRPKVNFIPENKTVLIIVIDYNDNRCINLVNSMNLNFLKRTNKPLDKYQTKKLEELNDRVKKIKQYFNFEFIDFKESIGYHKPLHIKITKYGFYEPLPQTQKMCEIDSWVIFFEWLADEWFLDERKELWEDMRYDISYRHAQIESERGKRFIERFFLSIDNCVKYNRSGNYGVTLRRTDETKCDIYRNWISIHQLGYKPSPHSLVPIMPESKKCPFEGYEFKNLEVEEGVEAKIP